MARLLSPAVREHADRLFGYHDVSEPPRPADLIVGLGSYQPAVADHCARLYREGLAPTILFTGGQGNWTRGALDRPEALVFRDRAVAAGVPAAAVLIEPEATNLGENAALSRRLLGAGGIDVRRIIVVTKRNTTRRAVLTFRQIWPAIAVSAQGPNLHWSAQAVPPRTAADVVDEMVGDLQRILVYPALGHQAPDRVPADVMAAYRALIDAGFTGHLLAGQPVVPEHEPPTHRGRIT